THDKSHNEAQDAEQDSCSDSQDNLHADVAGVVQSVLFHHSEEAAPALDDADVVDGHEGHDEVLGQNRDEHHRHGENAEYEDHGKQRKQNARSWLLVIPHGGQHGQQ